MVIQHGIGLFILYGMEMKYVGLMCDLIVLCIIDFFTNYGKVLGRTEELWNDSSASAFTNPHVFVPIVSAVVCTCALAVCVLILVRRR